MLAPHWRRDLSVLPPGIFKAYDIRGLYGEEMDGETAYADRPRVRPGARGPARQADGRAAGRARSRHAAPGAGDGRARCARGSLDEGVDRPRRRAWSAPRCSISSSARSELDGGAMITASHNPKAYTGVKLVREGALALSGDAGIGDVRDMVVGGLPRPAGRRVGRGGRRLRRLPPARALVHRPRAW